MPQPGPVLEQLARLSAANDWLSSDLKHWLARGFPKMTVLSAFHLMSNRKLH